MHGDGSASGGSLGIEEAELGVAFGQSVLVVEHGLDELINDILAQLFGGNESSLDSDAGDVGILTGVGAGSQVVTDQERIASWMAASSSSLRETRLRVLVVA